MMDESARAVPAIGWLVRPFLSRRGQHDGSGPEVYVTLRTWHLDFVLTQFFLNGEV
jgi:hypothetical protein